MMPQDLEMDMGLDDEEEEGHDGAGPAVSNDQVRKLDELMRRATPAVERLHQLYQQFMAGVLSKPPIEERNRIDQLINQLNLMQKPTPAYRFRFQNLLNTYNTYRKLWDKKLADLESGKVKRPAGPKR